jgi:hypothetical protein
MRHQALSANSSGYWFDKNGHSVANKIKPLLYTIAFKNDDFFKKYIFPEKD